MTQRQLLLDYIKLVYQLYNFRAIQYKYTERIIIVDDLIDKIIAQYLVQASRYMSERRYSRSSSIDPITGPSTNIALPEPFPGDWAIDRAKLNAAVKKFSIYCNKYFPHSSTPHRQSSQQTGNPILPDSRQGSMPASR
jgi:hypothetical protein